MLPASERLRKGAKFLGAGFGFAIAMFLGFYLFWWRLPVGQGPAGPAVNRDQFISSWTTQAVFLVGMGDSVTAGFGASAGHSYFDRLVKNPPEETSGIPGICLTAVLPNLRWTNLAISGSTSLQHVKAQLPRLVAQPPNVLGVVVITTGGNDIIHNYGRTPPAEGAMFGATLPQAKPWIQRFELRLDAMVEAIKGKFPGGCHIFLANIYDPTDGTGNARRVGLPPWRDSMPILEAYNRIIAQCAAKHPSVHLVNIHDPFLGHGLYCTQFWRPHYSKVDPHYWYHDKLEDPNDRGYDSLRRIFLNAIAEKMRSATGAPGRNG